MKSSMGLFDYDTSPNEVQDEYIMGVSKDPENRLINNKIFVFHRKLHLSVFSALPVIGVTSDKYLGEALLDVTWT